MDRRERKARGGEGRGGRGGKRTRKYTAGFSQYTHTCNILLWRLTIHLSRTDLTTFLLRMRTPATTTTATATITIDTVMATGVLGLGDSEPSSDLAEEGGGVGGGEIKREGCMLEKWLVKLH